MAKPRTPNEGSPHSASAATSLDFIRRVPHVSRFSRRGIPPTVILSAVASSHSDEATESKDPYPGIARSTRKKRGKGTASAVPQRLDSIQAPQGHGPPRSRKAAKESSPRRKPREKREAQQSPSGAKDVFPTNRISYTSRRKVKTCCRRMARAPRPRVSQPRFSPPTVILSAVETSLPAIARNIASGNSDRGAAPRLVILRQRSPWQSQGLPTKDLCTPRLQQCDASALACGTRQGMALAMPPLPNQRYDSRDDAGSPRIAQESARPTRGRARRPR